MTGGGGLRRLARRGLARLGYDLIRKAPPDGRTPPIDFDAQDRAIFEAVRPYTLTSPERVRALCEAIRYIQRARIPGAIVECGVWRGGSMLAAVLTLLADRRAPRDLYLFDTFDGRMPKPGPRDSNVYGVPAAWHHARLDAGEPADPRYSHMPVGDVVALLENAGYDRSLIHPVVGPVEETVPDGAPDAIALLRLDTDYEESTRHEMDHLFPRLAPGGVLLVDDYGFFEGAKLAVDEYLERNDIAMLLDRIDDSGVIGVVPRRET